MLLRHTLVLETGIIAIQYRTDTRKLTLGGNGRMLPMMHVLRREYFAVEDEDDTLYEYWIQSNKARLVMTLQSDAPYYTGLRMLQEHGMSLQSVTSHGTIMR